MGSANLCSKPVIVLQSMSPQAMLLRDVKQA